MSFTSQVIGPYTLLCEHCGYVLEGFERDGVCPECGDPIERSLPEVSRPGSCYQQDKKLISIAKAAWQLHVFPSALFRQLRIDRARRTRHLFVLNLAIAAFLPLLLPATAFLVPSSHMAQVTIDMFFFGPWVLMWLLMPLVLWILSKIEMWGVVFFSRKRGWRVDRAVAHSVVTHASIAWIWAVLGLMAGVFSQRLWYTQAMVLKCAPAIGFVAGMLVFETLVWAGVNRCKYANRRSPLMDDHWHDHSQSARADSPM